MQSNLIYIGDTIRFSETELKNVSNINGIYRTLYSTAEANINANVTLAFSRLDMRFRVKKEDKYYSDWYSINEIETGGPTTYANVTLDSTQLLDIDVEFILKSTPTGWDEDSDYITVSEVSSDVTRVADPPEPQYITPAANVSAIGRQNGLTYTPGFTYNPYALGEAQNLYNDMSFIVNEIYGHEVEYIKVLSNSDKGKDYIFREWNLYNVNDDSIKCLKVLVPNNDFADNRFLFSPDGVGYTDEFEIHIVDSYFKMLFGNDVFPEQRDFLYFPLLNRMYEVKSTYLKRAFNMQPSYWKCTLTKWEPKQNIIYDNEDTKNKILDNMFGLDKAFGKEVEEESDNILDELQLKPKLVNLDNIRDYVAANMKIEEDILDTDYTLISNTQYNLESIYDRFSDRKVAIKYKYKYVQGIGEDKTMFMWVNPQKVVSNSYNVTSTGTSTTRTLTLTTGTYPEQFEVDGLITVYKKGTPKVIKGVLKITSISLDRTSIVAYSYDDTLVNSDVELVALSVERELLISGTDTYIKRDRTRTFSYGDSNLGIRFWIIDNTFVYLNYFGTLFRYKLSNSLKDGNWYGVVLSLNKHNQEVGLYVYERVEEDGSLTLDEIYQKTLTGLGNVANTSTYNMYLVDTPLKVTNVRLVSNHVEADLHSTYLMRKLVDNGHFAEIVDNAYPNRKYKMNE